MSRWVLVRVATGTDAVDMDAGRVRSEAGWAMWALAAATVLAVAAARLRLLDLPLDRDEGEYAYMGQLLLQGLAPYAGAYNMKFPGTPMVYAAVLALSESAAAIRAALLAANLATTVLVFLAGRRLGGPGLGVPAAAVFAVLSVNPYVLGLAAYAEHFVLLAALGGWLLVLGRPAGPARLLAAGALLGLAILCKQPGLFLLVPVLAEAWRARRLAGMGLVLAGAAAPIAAVVVWIAAAGTFETFWFWTVTYGRKYATAVPAPVALELFLSTGRWTFSTVFACVVLAAAGGTVLFGSSHWAAIRRPVGLLALGAFAGTSVGFYYRAQYFIPFLPVLALLAAVALDWLARAIAPPARGRAIATAALAAALIQALVASGDLLFRLPPNQVARTVYGFNPFPEAVAIGRYLQERTAPSDRIAVIGSEPQIYFYADRRAATGHIYTYALMEPHELAPAMQREMVQQIEGAEPAYVVFVNVHASWLRRPQSHPYLLAWFEEYRRRHLDQVAVVELVSPALSVFHSGPGARDVVPRSAAHLTVYRRRGA